MKCEKCGKEMSLININVFDFDGGDRDHLTLIQDEDEDAVMFETSPNWTGYELSEEEMAERISCPHCGKFPFKNEEIQVYDVVRIVCFKTNDTTEKGGESDA